jgi:3-deoxy-manno-octulosonate cytidylyltransferase (CMP-KDO synthetase)
VIWAVLPARLASTRLPGKVLADLHGRTMLEHVWRRTCAAGCFDRVAVATDDPQVAAAAEAFGADVIPTGPARSGTDRVAMAVGDARVAVVNVQADQPLLDPRHLEVLAAALREGEVTTLSAPGAGDPADPARVKVEVDPEGFAAAFSRKWSGHVGRTWRLHVGLYGFAPGVLGRCVTVGSAASAADEDLEQVAWLRAGIAIRVVPVDHASPSVDTPTDLALVRELLCRGPEVT